MSRPLVSIVIPTYDRAGMVETAIMSVLEQDYDRLEVIVLDDGSHDETPAVLERIARRSDPDRFRSAQHDNVGQAETINRGLAQARGELLGYLSSDDYLLPGAIGALVAAAEAHPDADVVYPWFALVDHADRVIDTIECLEHTFADALRWAVCMPGVGALVRRRLYERIGGWDPSYRYCPDYAWWLRARDARFVRVPEVLGAWRSHDGSLTLSGGGFAHMRERLRLLDETFAQEDLPPDVRAVKREAYATTLIQAAASLLGGELGAAEQRFVVEDRLGPLYSHGARDETEADRLQLLSGLRAAEQQVRAAGERIDQLEQTIAALNDAAAHREQRVAQLEARDAEREAEARAEEAPSPPAASDPRPPWLRAARTLVPPSLRPRVGAVLHRLRSDR